MGDELFEAQLIDYLLVVLVAATSVTIGLVLGGLMLKWWRRRRR